VTSASNNGSDSREDEVAEMARRAALAASDKRRRARSGTDGPTAEDVDESMMARLSSALEDISEWSPGFAGAMLFRGEATQPLVSLIVSAEREAVRRALTHVATSVRMELDLIERDALGSFVDSVTSTERGAVIVIRLGDDLLIVALEGQPARIADTWQAIANQRGELAAAASGLIREH
jgi:hypothetical protein